MRQKATKITQNSSDTTPTSESLAMAVVAGMQEKKAIEVKMLDLRAFKNAVTDFFVICSCSSDTHTAAIKDSVEKIVKEQVDISPWKTEGENNREWILLDYVDVVVHIFLKDKRSFYGLEDLWGDAKITEFES